MSDAATHTATVERLFDAFHKAAAPGVSVLDALLATRLFLMHVEGNLTPNQRERYRQGMQSFKDMYDGAPEAFS
jgi:hypothetical protein